MKPRSSWDTVWIDVATVVSERSSCDRSSVGAVIVKDNRVVSTGYNGPASGYPVDTNVGCSAWCTRASNKEVNVVTVYGYDCPSIHAEANALLHASRKEVEGATIYVTSSPCADCTKLISNSGISRVIMQYPPESHRPDPRPYLLTCGIDVTVLYP